MKSQEAPKIPYTIDNSKTRLLYITHEAPVKRGLGAPRIIRRISAPPVSRSDFNRNGTAYVVTAVLCMISTKKSDRHHHASEKNLPHAIAH